MRNSTLFFYFGPPRARGENRRFFGNSVLKIDLIDSNVPNSKIAKRANSLHPTEHNLQQKILKAVILSPGWYTLYS